MRTEEIERLNDFISRVVVRAKRKRVFSWILIVVLTVLNIGILWWGVAW